MNEPLFQKLINKFSKFQMIANRAAVDNSAISLDELQEAIYGVTSLVREIHLEHMEYQRVNEATKNSTHPLDLVAHGTIADEFIRKIF